MTARLLRSNSPGGAKKPKLSENTMFASLRSANDLTLSQKQQIVDLVVVDGKKYCVVMAAMNVSIGTVRTYAVFVVVSTSWLVIFVFFLLSIV